MTKSIMQLLCAGILLVALCQFADAQETTSAGIVGQVFDASKAAVPDALVTVMNVGTNASRTARTDAEGAFSIPNLASAQYQIRIEKQGFQSAIIEPFDLRIGEIARRTIELRVGALTDSIVIEANAPLLETENGTLSQVIDTKQISELPLNGRNLVQLAALAAGVSPRQSLQRSVSQYGDRNEFVQVDGGRDASTNYVIDGVYARSLRFNNLAFQPSVDTIHEFNVLRNSFSAEYGQGQSVVTAVTKSGTNNLHGSAFEFLRNDALDARNFFAAQKPPYRRNQFGGTAGGPVIKNKFFVFGGYEGLKTRKGLTLLGSVPSQSLLNGDFSSISTPIVDPLSGAPFPNNQIPVNRVSHFASILGATIPAPNVAGKNNYITNRTFIDDYSTVTFRADQVLSSKHTLFERYIWYDASQIGPATFTATTYPQTAQNFSLGDTYVISTTVVNDLRLGYNRANNLWQQVSLNGANWVQTLGLHNLAAASDPLDFGRPPFSIAGFSGQGEGAYTQGALENNYSVSDTISKVWGKHTLRTGIQLQNRRFFHITEVLPRGNFAFDGRFTGNSTADFLLGYCSSCAGALGSSRSNYRSNTVAPFINDEWRVNQKLSINLGLRYDYLGWWREQANQEGAFDPASGKIGFHKVPTNIPAALQPLIINKDNFYPAGLITPDKNNWAPRVGVAYRMTEKTIIRSGFGVYYDNPNLNELQFNRLLPPFYFNRTILPDKSSPVLVDNLFPGLNDISQIPAPFSVMVSNRMPYVLQWNFNVQRTLTRDLLLEVAYTGSGGRKLPRRVNQNEADFGTTPLITRLPYPQFDPGIFTAINDGLSNFNAVSLRIEKRYSKGLYFLGNYQYSKNIDTNSGETDNSIAYRTNTRLNRALSAFDQRNRAVISAGYELPFGKGKPWLNSDGVSSFVFGGWQVQGIVSLLAGMPFTPSGAFVCSCGSYVPQWVNAVKPGFGKLSNPTPNAWYDPTAFALPAIGFQGNAGRNIIRGPGRNDLDLSMFKVFPISERVTIQFRAEFFNVTNHPSFGFPDGNISNVTAGVISSAYDGRSIQFGLRMVW
jgi:hypothetical protein